MSLPGLFVTGTDTGVGKTRVASAIARAWTASGRRVGVLKPVASGGAWRDGALISPDADELIEAIGGLISSSVPPSSVLPPLGGGTDGGPEAAPTAPEEAPSGSPFSRGRVLLDAPRRVAPIVFEEPLAPPVAARRLGSRLAAESVEAATRGALGWWSGRADAIVIEGVGGLLCPIAEGWAVADLAVALDYPLLIVAHRGLGTLHQTIATVEAALGRGLRVAGVVLNGARPPSDPAAEATNAFELARRLPGVAIVADYRHGETPGAGTLAPEADDWYNLASLPRFRAYSPTPPDI